VAISPGDGGREGHQLAVHHPARELRDRPVITAPRHAAATLLPRSPSPGGRRARVAAGPPAGDHGPGQSDSAPAGQREQGDPGAVQGRGEGDHEGAFPGRQRQQPADQD